MPSSIAEYLSLPLWTSEDNISYLIRIVVAAVLGLIIGVERTRRQKDAGTRTHCIIAVTAATFMIVSKYGFSDIGSVSGSNSADPARIASQVVSGISFLGAGVIFRDRNDSIKGLTTAAGIWATAAVGMAVGSGMYVLSMLETAAITLSQMLLHRFPVGNDAYITQEISIKYDNDAEVQEQVALLIQNHNGSIEKSDIVRDGNMVTMNLFLRLRKHIAVEDSIALLNACSGIKQISL